MIAAPYTARRCPVCGEWVYVDNGPFAEGGDRTKTLADYNHWAAEHATPEELAGPTVGFPYFFYNDEPVEVVVPTNVTTTRTTNWRIS